MKSVDAVLITSLKTLYTGAAERYDCLNSIITFRLDALWRNACARECRFGQIVVDLCCGTGKLTEQISRHLSSETVLIGVDFNKAMLNKAILKKSVRQTIGRSTVSYNAVARNRPSLTFMLADAAHLPFKDSLIDSIGMAFSFRNLMHENPKARLYIREIVRILRANGTLAFVETGQPNLRIVNAFFRFYCLKVIPLIGQLLSRQRRIYQYLGMSAANFPGPDGFQRSCYRQDSEKCHSGPRL
jgi:demethylmenaquinone methyltransferase / 2-methoxy-6-polyprenyl-1,4-benzoquinol methylase